MLYYIIEPSLQDVTCFSQEDTFLIRFEQLKKDGIKFVVVKGNACVLIHQGNEEWC